MKTTPIKKLTFWVSAVLTAAAIVCICLGLFQIAAYAGTAAAVNMLAGALLRGY